MLPHYPCLMSGCCVAACLEDPSLRVKPFKAPADLPARPSDPVPGWYPSSRLSLVAGGRHTGSGFLPTLSLFIAWLYLPPIIRFDLLSLTFGLRLPCSEALHVFKVD